MAVALALGLPSLAAAQSQCAVASVADIASASMVADNYAAAITAPSVVVCAGGRSWTFEVAQDGKYGTLKTTDVDLGGGASFSVSATFNADPFSAFVFGSVLPGGFGPLTFDVYFTTPVVGGPYNFASSSGTLGVTAAGRSAVGTVSAGLTPFYITGLGDATNLGVDTGSGTCTVAVPPTPNSTSCNPSGATNGIAPFSPAFLTARLSYTHTTTGVGTSTVGWTGAVNLETTAPEPATVTMMVTGLLAIGGVATRRKRGT